MSAERLREAANVLRQRAKAATHGPWTSDAIYGSVTALAIPATAWRARVHERRVIDEDGGMSLSDASYVATMHPGVGLALADWLGDEAKWVEADGCYMHDEALAVADAILGGQS